MSHQLPWLMIAKVRADSSTSLLLGNCSWKGKRLLDYFNITPFAILISSLLLRSEQPTVFASLYGARNSLLRHLSTSLTTKPEATGMRVTVFHRTFSHTLTRPPKRPNLVSGMLLVATVDGWYA